MTPDLPRPVGRRSFLKQTVAEWESWPWDTWTPSQVAHATRTIVLIDDLNRAATADERVKLDQPVRQALRVLGLTKRDDEDERRADEEREAEQRLRDSERYEVAKQQRAIRAGVEVDDLHRCWCDREGNRHDSREILFMQTDADWSCLLTPDLEDERQAAAEADGTWPEFTVKEEADENGK